MATILLDNAAGHEILVNAYASTTDTGISAALNGAHTRGVDIPAGRTARRPARANRRPGCFPLLTAAAIPALERYHEGLVRIDFAIERVDGRDLLPAETELAQ